MASKHQPQTLQRRTANIAWKTAVAAAAAAVFGVVIYVAFSENNRAKIAHATEASPWLFAALAGCSVVSIGCFGLSYWLIYMPAKRLRLLDVMAVNAIAFFCAPVPAKLSLVVRFLAHRKRDGMAYSLITAGILGIGAMTAATLGPLAMATILRPKIDALWGLMAAGGVVCACAAGMGVAALLRSRPPLHRATLRTGDLFVSPALVTAQAAARLVDTAALAGRFALAAIILGVDMAGDEAVILAAVYFFAGLVSPAGNLGSREGAVVLLGYLPNATQLTPETLAAVALTVTVTEIIISTALAIPAAVFLRLDRLILGSASPEGVQPTAQTQPSNGAANDLPAPE